MDFYGLNQEKANTAQAQIDQYCEALVDYVKSKGGQVFLKNTMHIQPRLASKADALITESVGDSSGEMCSQFTEGYGKFWKGRAWFDFSYKTGTRCRIPGMTALLQNKQGVWQLAG